MSEIEDIIDTEFDEQLQQQQQQQLDDIDVVDSHVNKRLDMSEELLDVVSDAPDDTLSTLGMPWAVSGIVSRS